MEQAGPNFEALDFKGNKALYEFYRFYIERIVHFRQSLARAFYNSTDDSSDSNVADNYDRWLKQRNINSEKHLNPLRSAGEQYGSNS